MIIAPGFRTIPTLIALVIATALTFVLHLNEPVFLWLNHLGSVLPDDFWAFWSYIGDGLVVVVLMLLLAWRYPRLLWAGFIALILSSSSISILKDYFYMARPPVVLPNDSFNIIGAPLTYLSFPSGHSATGFLVATLLMHQFQSVRATRVLLVIAGMIALSRIMVGAHWPADILGGAVWGIVLGWVSLRLADNWPWGETLWGQRLLVPVFLYACGMMYDNEAGFGQFLCLSKLLAVWIGAFGLYYWYELWRNPRAAGFE